MSTSETQGQDSTAIITAGDDAEVVDDTPDWGGPSIEYNRYGESAGHNYVRRPMRGAKVLDDEASAVSHRLACRYE